MTLLAEQVPEDDGRGHGRVIVQADLFGAFEQLRRGAAGLGQARKVALHVGEEHRDASSREALSQDLQRDGLAGAGGAGDQAVPVREPQGKALRRFARAKKDLAVVDHACCAPNALEIAVGHS